MFSDKTVWGQTHQFSRGDNFHKLYLLTLYDSIAMVFSYGVFGLVGSNSNKVHFMKERKFLMMLLALHNLICPCLTTRL